MSNDEIFIYKSIVKDMAEGVITIGFDGIITSVNPACEKILEVDTSIIGSPFAVNFFEYSENDGFNQAVLDAIYETTTTHNTVVDFFTGEKNKKLFITTSYLKNKQGVIVVVNDVSELYELKDAIAAMEKIKALNEKLELRNKLISETFGRYLSDEIVKKLLDTPNGLQLGGKKQRVTILMSDIRGFTAMSEVMEATDLITMLNNYLGDMTVIVQKYGGTIIEFIGDAIFAIFGAPLESKIPEFNATACAIEMQNRMKAVNEFNIKNNFKILEMGIGINTGEVILGNIGSEKRAKYGVVGQNVNLAGRIESYTVGGQILISESTKEKIDGIHIKSETEILPKGVPIPITIYDVAGIGDLMLDVSQEEFKPLNPPIEVEMHVIDGKFALKEGTPAKILEVSERQAIVDVNFDKTTNVKFLVDGKEVFAKFIDNKKIHITAGEILHNKD